MTVDPVRSERIDLAHAEISGDYVRAIGRAAERFFEARRALPGVLTASVDVWADLVAQVDPTGAPLFPALVSSTGGDVAVLGMTFRVDPDLGPKTLLMEEA